MSRAIQIFLMYIRLPVAAVTLLADNDNVSVHDNNIMNTQVLANEQDINNSSSKS